jgi:hypothetical protein
MENSSIEKGGYQNAKREARECYFKIGRVWCPALNDYITFNAVGFRHLVRKRGILRSTDEQLRRFSLILLAKDIIENPSAAIFHDKSIINIRAANFWTLSMRHEDGIIKVIIRQLDGGAKHFFSVY